MALSVPPNSSTAVFCLKVATGDKLTDLSLQIFPGAGISGRILDFDGDPVPGSNVTLWKRIQKHGQATYEWAGEIESSRAGEYLFEGLLPGTYFVRAKPDSVEQNQVPVDSSGKVTRMREVTTYFPASLSRSEAQAVVLEKSEELSGIDIHIQHALAMGVKGRVTGLLNPIAEYSLVAALDDGGSHASEPIHLLPNGDFEASDLLPGKHTLMLLTDGPNGRQKAGEADINLIDQDLTDIVITPFKPAQLRVRVFMEGEPAKPITAGAVSLLNQSGRKGGYRAQFPPRDGVYFFDNVSPGKYWPWF